MSFSVCERCGMTFQCGDTAHACVVEQFTSCQPKFGEWQPIETAPSETKEMFVVKAFNVCNVYTNGKAYTSDPWCVWREKDGKFARWPHHFKPTHWMQLPEAPK